MKRIFIFFIFILVGFGFFLWQGFFSSKERLERELIFTIEKGQNLFQIGENLHSQNLIKNRFFFDFYIFIKGAQGKLQAGEYQLSPSMAIAEIAEKIISGDIVKEEITIIEGSNIKLIEEKFNEIFNFPPSFRERAGSNKFSIFNFQTNDFKKSFEFLESAPDEAGLEGFLFPDTYEFSLDATTEDIVEKMLDNFDKKLTSDLREKIKKQGKTIFEIVTMASLIEKEVKTKEDKKLVSGILWKRLEVGMPLQVDATITYIIGKKMIKISKEETGIDSPYNTYKYPGLPKGPICNPGLDSILAAVYPKSSDYWYYLSTPEGKTIFSKTLEEHNIAKAKHLQ